MWCDERRAARGKVVHTVVRASSFCSRAAVSAAAMANAVSASVVLGRREDGLLSRAAARAASEAACLICQGANCRMSGRDVRAARLQHAAHEVHAHLLLGLLPCMHFHRESRLCLKPELRFPVAPAIPRETLSAPADTCRHLPALVGTCRHLSAL